MHVVITYIIKGGKERKRAGGWAIIYVMEE